MALEYAILGFLSTGDLSGYDLKTKCFDGVAAYFWTADQAQIYRTLGRLEDQGLVKSGRQRQRRRPDRRVYSITPAGREALLDWLARPLEPPTCRDALLVQVYFGSDIPQHALADVLVARRAAHQARLDRLRARVATLAGEPDDRRVTLHRMTLDAAIAHERASIDWIDDCLDRLSDALVSGSADTRRGFFGTEEPWRERSDA